MNVLLNLKTSKGINWARNVMEDFKSYLLSKHISDKKKAEFYLYWVNLFYRHCNKHNGESFDSEDIDQYLKFLAKSREDWQVKQASEAIQLYRFFKNRQIPRTGKHLSGSEQWRVVGEDMYRMLRLKHLSFRTEQAYLGWLRRFYLFMDGTHVVSKNKLGVISPLD